MTTMASTYVDLPYDELYEASRIRIALTHGISYSADETEHPEELGVFEGRLISFCPNTDHAEAELDLRVPVRLVLYREWDSGIPEFESAPSSELGAAAVGIGRYDEGHYNCRIAVRDQAENLTHGLFTALLGAALAGQQEIEVTLSGRRDFTPVAEKIAASEAASTEQNEYAGFVDNYAWSECGVEPDEFGRTLDAGENAPPVAHFEVMQIRIEVDVRRIARLLGTKEIRPKAKGRSM